jgi:hypothetical protein
MAGALRVPWQWSLNAFEPAMTGPIDDISTADSFDGALISDTAKIMLTIGRNQFQYLDVRSIFIPTPNTLEQYCISIPAIPCNMVE